MSVTGPYVRVRGMAGDHPHDIELARNAGAYGVYVLTGHGAKHAPELPHDATMASDIEGAVDWILGVAAHGGPCVPLR